MSQLRRQLFEFKREIFQQPFWCSFTKEQAIVDIWKFEKLQEVSQTQLLGPLQYFFDLFILAVEIFIYKIMLARFLGLDWLLIKGVLCLWQSEA